MPLSIAEVAQVAYTEATIRLDDVAREFAGVADELASSNQPLTARKVRIKATRARHYAAIAYRAGRAEKINPEPDAVRPCSLCRGVRVCDLTAHLSWVRA